jgi:hypothetical protein
MNSCSEVRVFLHLFLTSALNRALYPRGKRARKLMNKRKSRPEALTKKKNLLHLVAFEPLFLGIRASSSVTALNALSRLTVNTVTTVKAMCSEQSRFCWLQITACYATRLVARRQTVGWHANWRRIHVATFRNEQLRCPTFRFSEYTINYINKISSRGAWWSRFPLKK